MSACTHATTLNLYESTGFTVELCTWECKKRLISLVDARGVNITVPVDAIVSPARLARALELLRAVNKTGGVVVELYNGRYLRDWITELLAEIDGGGK